jgi:hypothetical protein
MCTSRLRRASALAASVCAALVSACSGLFGPDERAGLSCLDDSPQCVEQRQSTLKTMLADKEHRWVREPPTPEAHASGVRLFAFRSSKKELSCEELTHGRKEAEAASKTLKGPAGKGLSPAQVARASMFAAEVSRELAAEAKTRRCKA